MRPRVSFLGLAKASLTLLLVACVLAAEAVAYSSPTSLNGIASTLAGRKVTVRCLTPRESANDPIIGGWGAEAYVEGWLGPSGRWHPKSYAVFKYGHCENLLALMRGDASGRSVYSLTWSTLALTHESGHLRGAPWSFSEAKTQCWAMQHLRSTLNMLGYRAPETQALVLRTALWIHTHDLAEEYQEPGCLLPTP